VLLVAWAFIAAGLGLAAIWMRTGRGVRQRVREALTFVGLVAITAGGCMFVTSSWDASESRMNSFSRADEAALRTIGSRLRIEAHLAPEDPRRSDFEHRAMRKLHRVLPSTEVTYVSATSVGLFEQATSSYGEVWYELGGRRSMNRAVTAEAVLETIYELAGVAAPSTDADEGFRGHPLDASPRGAAVIFFGIWPGVVLLTWWRLQRRRG
jgi:hypothetical protein